MGSIQSRLLSASCEIIPLPLWDCLHWHLRWSLNKWDFYVTHAGTYGWKTEIRSLFYAPCKLEENLPTEVEWFFPNWMTHITNLFIYLFFETGSSCIALAVFKLRDPPPSAFPSAPLGFANLLFNVDSHPFSFAPPTSTPGQATMTLLLG